MKTRWGYHASHEQFAPSELLRLVAKAETLGFDAAKCSDHFHPWSENQGQSGYAWSWLGSVMERTKLPMGIISAPGYRYHPAILAQAAATLTEMYPDRLWLSLGSGEAINESITGLHWPEKAERNARLGECVSIIRALLAGETVTHRGRVTCIEAKLYSRPKRPPLLIGAAVTEATARWCGQWADGLLTTASEPKELQKVLDAFREGGGEGKPLILQAAVAWAPTEAEAEKHAIGQWAANAAGGEVNWDLRRPKDFDTVAALVGADEIRKSVKVTSDFGVLTEWLRTFAEMGLSEIHLHPVGRNQDQFLEAFAEKVLPQLR